MDAGILKKNKSWILLSLMVGLFFSCSAVYAFEARTSTVSKNYTHDFSDGGASTTVANGNLSVMHSVEMTSGGTSIAPGEVINFSYDPEKPFYNGTGASFDTPYGKWCSSINNQCFSDIKDGQELYIDGNLRGYVYWTAVKPSVSLSSSDSGVVSCSGMSCTANNPGTVTLTADISKTNSRIWSVASVRRGHADGWPYRRFECKMCDGYDPGNEYCGGCRDSSVARTEILGVDRCNNNWNIHSHALTWVFWSPSEESMNPGGGGDCGNMNKGYDPRVNGTWGNTMKLGSTSVTWIVEVADPVTDGECNVAYDGQEIYTLPGDTSLLCSAGTLANLVDNPTGWTWDCLGDGGGTDTSCSADFAEINLSLLAIPANFEEESIASFPVSTTLVWNAENVDSCSVGANWSGYNPNDFIVDNSSNGDRTDVINIDIPNIYTYSITCQNSKSDSVIESAQVQAFCKVYSKDRGNVDLSACNAICDGGQQFGLYQNEYCVRIEDNPYECNMTACSPGWHERGP